MLLIIAPLPSSELPIKISRRKTSDYDSAGALQVKVKWEGRKAMNICISQNLNTVRGNQELEPFHDLKNEEEKIVLSITLVCSILLL